MESFQRISPAFHGTPSCASWDCYQRGAVVLTAAKHESPELRTVRCGTVLFKLLRPRTGALQSPLFHGTVTVSRCALHCFRGHKELALTPATGLFLEGMRTVNVSLGARSYPIFIGSNLLSGLGPQCAKLGLGKRCAVISDGNVARRYARTALASLRTGGFDPVLITVPRRRKFQKPPLRAGLLRPPGAASPGAEVLYRGAGRRRGGRLGGFCGGGLFARDGFRAGADDVARASG